jgi:hypothetical protein
MSIALLSPRRRAALLYRQRREALLAEPIAALRRAGLTPTLDDDFLAARSDLEDGGMLEVGFRVDGRIFGVLIDTLWTLRTSSKGPEERLVYRFGRHPRFVAARGRAGNLANRLNRDHHLRELIAQAELRNVLIDNTRSRRLVQLRPAPGTLTAVYFPPMPPLSVPMKPAEADAHIDILRRLGAA